MYIYIYTMTESSPTAGFRSSAPSRHPDPRRSRCSHPGFSHGKTMGKPWENAGFPWENGGFPWDFMGVTQAGHDGTFTVCELENHHGLLWKYSGL